MEELKKMSNEKITVHAIYPSSYIDKEMAMDVIDNSIHVDGIDYMLVPEVIFKRGNNMHVVLFVGRGLLKLDGTWF
jgi:hypothetical protein